MQFKNRKIRGKEVDPKKDKLKKRLRTKVQIYYELTVMIHNISVYPDTPQSQFIQETVDRVLEIAID